jgi:carboxypeptidase C (cathepsin A)
MFRIVPFFVYRMITDLHYRSSSMMGIFQEHGPCSVDANLKTHDNPYSWTNVTNILYIDQPTHTGFSYSVPIPGFISDLGLSRLSTNRSCPRGVKTCGTFSKPDKDVTASSSPGAAPNFWKTVQGFMGALPKYARKEIIFATESYGGRYGPIYSEYFARQNLINTPGAVKIHVSALMIGNGWHDASIQYPAYYNYTVNPGNTYDVKPYNSTVAKKMHDDIYGPGRCLDQLQTCYKNGTNQACAMADAFCDYVTSAPYSLSARDTYDIRQLEPSPFPPEHYQKYLNTPKVLQAIGAFTNYTDGSDVVGATFASTGDNARPHTVMVDMRRLLESGTTVLLYYGDADYVCNWIGGEIVAEEVGAHGFGSAGYVDISTSDKIVHGEVKQSNNFAFVRVYDSGHMVPYFKPLVSLEMLKRVIKKVDIATGTEVVKRGYVTKGPKKTTYREGNGTVVWSSDFAVRVHEQDGMDDRRIVKKWRFSKQKPQLHPP